MTSHNLTTTASELLNQMREAGFIVSLNSEKLEVRQARWIDDELAELITHHKYELIDLLKLDLQAYRQAKAIELLNKTPMANRGIYIDHEAMPANVLLSIAIRDKGVVDMVIPKSKWNSYKVFALADTNCDKYNEGALNE